MIRDTRAIEREVKRAKKKILSQTLSARARTKRKKQKENSWKIEWTGNWKTDCGKIDGGRGLREYFRTEREFPPPPVRSRWKIPFEKDVLKIKRRETWNAKTGGESSPGNASCAQKIFRKSAGRASKPAIFRSYFKRASLRQIWTRAFNWIWKASFI